MRHIKQIPFFGWCIAGIIAAVSCTKADLIKYQTPDSIYFLWADVGFQDEDILGYRYAFDSVNVSFAGKPESLEDTVFKIPIMVTGAPSDRDRFYKVVVAPGSTAEPGIHYAPLSDTYVFHKGLVQDSLPIRFIRAAGLRESRKSLRLQLVASEDFSTNLLYSITEEWGWGGPNIITELNPTFMQITIDDI